jgi:DHA1 family bicyclomycin/chloramphenicol resistance-like MFS transporter
VLSSVQTMLGGFLGALVGLAYDDTVLPLSLGFVAMSAASFVVIALTERQRLFGRTAPAEVNA